MSKKELTVEERVKKHGNSIAGVGIFYAIISAIVIVIQGALIFLNPVSLIINVALFVDIILMALGAAKRQKYGVICGWIFEAYLLICILLSFLGMASADIIALIVAIWLPSDLTKFSKALKELN